MKKTFILKKITWAVCACAGVYASASMASGYHFGTQSVTSQSTANASSAEAADASTIFYNPAGISKLEGTHLSANVNLVAPNVEYRNAEATYFPRLPNTPLNKVNGKSSGTITESLVAVPHFYLSHQLSDDWTFGLGIYVPFASGTDYQRDSVLRYNVNKMGMKSIDINPVFSYKINNNHSVSIGAIGQYLTAELRQYANWGGYIGQDGRGDGYAEVDGTDWGLGYTLGYLWDVNDKVRVGASYRSKISHTLNGSAKWSPDVNSPLYKSKPELTNLVQSPFDPTKGTAGFVPSEDASVALVTPESFSVHGMAKLDDKWTAFGDVTWTRHSRFNTIKINYENPKVVPNVNGDTKPGCTQGKNAACLSDKTILQPNWRDTFRIGIGGAYQYNDNLQLRFGVAYDQSPVKSDEYRLSTLPDNDRIWFSLGAKYDINENSSLNLGYSYVHIKDAHADVNGYCGSLKPARKGAVNCVSSRTKGSTDYKANAHLLGIQYNYNF